MYIHRVAGAGSQRVANDVCVRPSRSRFPPPMPVSHTPSTIQLRGAERIDKKNEVICRCGSALRKYPNLDSPRLPVHFLT